MHSDEFHRKYQFASFRPIFRLIINFLHLPPYIGQSTDKWKLSASPTAINRLNGKQARAFSSIQVKTLNQFTPNCKCVRRQNAPYHPTFSSEAILAPCTCVFVAVQIQNSSRNIEQQSNSNKWIS